MHLRSIVLAVLWAATPAVAAPAPGTDAFQKAYSQSFYAFDLCGNPDLGKSYRRALAEKVDHCPFPVDAKAAFRHWTADADAAGPAAIQRYVAEHDRLPESLDEKRVACRKEKDIPAYQQTVDLLAGYAKGTVKYDSVVPDPCDVKAAAPQ